MFRDALYRTLSWSALYLTTQKLFGAHRLRRLCVGILDARNGERVLDVGCGPAYILDYLPSVAYYGFDAEPRYIRHARRRYGSRGSFAAEPVTAARLAGLPPFDGILLMGLLHHLPDDHCRQVLALLSSALTPGGRVVTLDPCFVAGQSRIARFVAAHDRGRYVRDEPGYRRLVDPSFAEVDVRVVHNVGRLPSTEIIMRLSAPCARPADSR